MTSPPVRWVGIIPAMITGTVMVEGAGVGREREGGSWGSIRGPGRWS